MSEVNICNEALAMIGETPIRSLDEDNRKAGLCKVLYPRVRDFNLAMQDWSFARKTSLLRILEDEHPEGAVFQIPSDCLTPLNLYPRPQTRLPWKVEQDKIIIPWLSSEDTDAEVYLQYTFKCTNTSIFSEVFKNILANDLAYRMCMPLTQDAKLYAALASSLRIIRLENAAEDANRGDEYRYADEDPENDTFVNPPE